MFPRIVEIVVIVLVVWFLFSQVAWPLIDNKPLFPMFGKKNRARLEKEYEYYNEKLGEKKLQAEVEELKKQVEKPESELDNK